MATINRYLLKLSLLQTILAVIIVLVASPLAYGLTAEERRNYAYRGIEFIDDACAPTTGGFTEGMTLAETQIANVKTIIGIAKSYNLGKQGALIGLMTALTESSLKNYANTGIPISMQNPSWLAIPEDDRPLGNDHDSVGIMQQRVSTGWSTYGNYTNGADPDKDKNITWQLMDPAYAAQAFFGTPPNAQLPSDLGQFSSALKKGLQNISNWQNMDPGEAAQRVQMSAFPDRYNQHKLEAYGFLTLYWDASPAVPLPISVTGGTSEGQGGGSCFTGGSQDSILQKIKEYAWPEYRRQGSAGAMDKKPAYQEAINRSSYKGGCNGVDCGAFVTVVMRESGADPDYNTGPEGNTTNQLAYLRRNSGAGGKYTRVNGKADLQPGDIAVRATGQFGGLAGHTFFYVGDAIDTDDSGREWKGQGASASFCGRAPMASGVDVFELYEWYHLNSE